MYDLTFGAETDGFEEVIDLNSRLFTLRASDVANRHVGWCLELLQTDCA